MSIEANNCPHWKWEKAVPKEVCEALIKEINLDGLEKGQIYRAEESGNLDTKIRNNRMTFMKFNHWFEGIMWNHIRYANASMKLNYFLSGCQPLQFSSYDPDEFYNWHTDSNFFNSVDGVTRKLSAVCLLSDKDSFSGGELDRKSTRLNSSHT